MQIYLSGIYIYFACLVSLCFFVCLFPINVKTTEPFGPNFLWSFTYKIRELCRLFNLFIEKIDGVISFLSVNYHASDGVISVLSVNYQASDGVISVLSVNYHASDGVNSVLSVNYHASEGVISVLSVNYHALDGVISVLSASYHALVISVLSVNY